MGGMELVLSSIETLRALSTAFPLFKDIGLKLKIIPIILVSFSSKNDFRSRECYIRYNYIEDKE